MRRDASESTRDATASGEDDINRLRKLFLEMAKIRAFEEAVAEGHSDGSLPGLLHLCMGSEGAAVGVLSLLGGLDCVYTGHRPHGHFLAMGVDPKAIMAELAGRETGLCRGRGGSMHLMSDRIMASGVVGGTLSIALGHALNQPSGAVVVAFFGDGAVQTGTFHETMNMASLWQAPVLFVCENNGWVEFSSRAEHTPVESVVSYGDLYGIPTRSVDGCDVVEVLETASELLEGIRNRSGPALLECRVSRLRPHYEGELRQQSRGHDPLDVLHDRLVALGDPASSLSEVRSLEVDAARRLRDEVLANEPFAEPAADETLVFARALR